MNYYFIHSNIMYFSEIIMTFTLFHEENSDTIAVFYYLFIK